MWSKWYPVADLGERQSPIDIVTAGAAPDPALADLKYEYDPAAIRLVNTGATWRMDFQSEGSNLSGGPLEGSYKGGGHKYRYTAKLCENAKTIIS